MQSANRFTSDTLWNVSYWVNKCHYKCTVSELAYMPINTESVAISHNIYQAAAKNISAQINIDLISLQSVRLQCKNTKDDKDMGDYPRRWRWPFRDDYEVGYIYIHNFRNVSYDNISVHCRGILVSTTHEIDRIVNLPYYIDNLELHGSIKWIKLKNNKVHILKYYAQHGWLNYVTAHICEMAEVYICMMYGRCNMLTCQFWDYDYMDRHLEKLILDDAILDDGGLFATRCQMGLVYDIDNVQYTAACYIIINSNADFSVMYRNIPNIIKLHSTNYNFMNQFPSEYKY